MADVIQQMRAEVNEAISGRMDMLNCINTALQNVSARPAESKPYRISDLIPRNWEGSNEKGEFRSFMSDLHLWMHAWSDQGEQMLARVESIDKFDNNVIAFDCPAEDFRSVEASLYHVLHRTTSNEPLRIVQEMRRQKEFEAWHATVRKYDQRKMSDKNSAYAALISNVSEKDRARDVEQFDDNLMTFTNEMNKFASKFGKIRDEEKMLAVMKLMPESLLKYRFRGTTMSYNELIIALENIIVDKVVTVPTVRNKKDDTSAPMEIGMAAKEDGENARRRRPKDHGPRSAGRLQRNWQRKVWLLARVRTGMRRVAKAARMEERTIGRKAVARKEAKGKRKAARETPERAGRAARQDTLQLGAGKEEARTCTPYMRMAVRTPKSRPRMKRICKHGV